MGRSYVFAVVVAVILVLSFLPGLSNDHASASARGEEYVEKWFVALKIEGGYVNTSLAEDLITSANLSVFTYVFRSGGRDYLIYRSLYSPFLVIEAYNDGGAAVVSLHYIPKVEDLLWRDSPCGGAIQCDFALINGTAVREAASAAGWDILELENRTYERCTTVTPGGAPPSCVEITEVRVVMGKNITGGFVEAKIFSSFSEGSMPWSKILFLTNNPGREASDAVNALMKHLLGINYEPSWSPTIIEPTGLSTAKNVLGAEATYLMKLGILDAGGLSSEDVYAAVYTLSSLNQTAELTQSGEKRLTSDYVPPNPLTIAEEISIWPCTTYLGVLHPYCTITTTVLTQTTTTTNTAPSATTHTATTKPTTASYPTNTGVTGTGTTVVGGATVRPPETDKDLTYLGIALILALIAAAITGALMRRY